MAGESCLQHAGDRAEVILEQERMHTDPHCRYMADFCLRHSKEGLSMILLFEGKIRA